MILSNNVVLVSIPMTTEEFVIVDKIVVNTSKDAEVKIAHISGQLKSFMNKREKPMAAHILHGQDLTQRSTDELLFSELGGKERAVTSWAEVYEAIKVQSRGQEESLNTKDYSSNIFFIPEDDSRPQENVHPVAVRCGSDGYDIMIYPPDSLGEWLVGGRIFKRAADAR